MARRGHENEEDTWIDNPCEEEKSRRRDRRNKKMEYRKSRNRRELDDDEDGNPFENFPG